MGKDNKKGKLKNEPKVSPKDKDIHLNVVGLPPKNVDVKKTYPRQNNEEYQLYRISIDTKGKQKERKHRLSSLEPSPKKTKHRKRYKSNDDSSISSDESFTNIPRPQKPRSTEGHKVKHSTPRARRKDDSDGEICFTIPGEKGKAIRIVGSSTKPLDDMTSRDSSPQQLPAKKGSEPRQVGFARLDEVYGTTPEESSWESRDSSPYKQTSPHVYNMENNSPHSVFKDPTNSKYAAGRTPSSQAISPLAKSSKDRQPENRSPRGEDHRTISHMPEYDRPSTSKYGDEEDPKTSQSKQSDPSRVRLMNRSTNETSSIAPSTSHRNSNYETTSGNSEEGKGKYPFYPYDKQKRSKSPSKQFQEPNREEDREPYVHQKLPSIPEVRSTEQYPSLQPSRSQGVGLPPKESLVSNHNTSTELASVKGNQALVPQSSPKPLKKQDEPVLKNEHHILRNPFKHKKPVEPNRSTPQEANKSTSLVQPNSSSNPSRVLTPSNTERAILGNKPILNDLSKSRQIQKSSHSNPSDIRPVSSGNSSVLYKTLKASQPQKPTQQITQSSSSTMSKIPKKSVNPVLNYNVPKTPSQQESPNTKTLEHQIKPQALTPVLRSTYSPLQKNLGNETRNVENPRESIVKPDQAKMNNKTPAIGKRPSTVDRQIMTDKRVSPKDRVLLEENNEHNKKSAPFSQRSVVESPLEHKLDKGQVAVNNKTPNVEKRPERVDKQIMTDKPLSPKERIMLEINEELSKTSSPEKSLHGSAKHNDSSHEKDSTRTKSKLSSFVSSIPKPLFRRNKSLEKKSTDKSVISNKSQAMVKSLEKNPHATKGKVNVKDDAKRPVEESAIIKQAHEPVVEAYPAWVNSPDQLEPAKKGSDIQSPRSKDSPLTGKNEPRDYSKEFVPYGVDDSSSVEIANRSYGEHPLARRASTNPTVTEQMNKSVVEGEEEDPTNYPGGQNRTSQGVDSELSKPLYTESRKRLKDSHSKGSDQDDLEGTEYPDHNSYDKSKVLFGGTNVLAFPGKTFEQSPFGYEPQFKPESTEEDEAMASLEDAFEAKRPKNDKLHPSSQSFDRNPSLVSRAAKNPQVEPKNTKDDLEGTEYPDQNSYDKSKVPFGGTNVLAFPGKTFEESPFGYESQFNTDPTEEEEAKASMEDAFEAKRPKKDKLHPSSQSFDRNPSLVSRAAKTAQEDPKNTIYGHPVQALSGSTDAQLFPEKGVPKEVNYDHNKPTRSNDRVLEQRRRADSESSVSKRSMNRSSHTPASLKGKDAKDRPLNESPFGKTTEDQQVYLGSVPDTTGSVFQPEKPKDGHSPYKEKSKAPIHEGLKGILIFVNKKNETASPFGKSSPSRKSDVYETNNKSQKSPTKKSKRTTSSSGGTSTSTSLQSSSYAGGDKKSVVERSPSGRKITQRFPCGCIRVRTSDTEDQLKTEELISAFCKDGSQCEISKAQGAVLGRSMDTSSSVSWEGSRPDRGFPDIEVIADGVVSRKPIRPRPPAPTMNGAKLTGSFKINSNKVNGVCNFYLDRKLKKYLRNNMDKIKLLLEDGYRR